MVSATDPHGRILGFLDRRNRLKEEVKTKRGGVLGRNAFPDAERKV
jgi:hypothetical protein